MERDVLIPAAHAALEGTLAVPGGARGVVVFAHGAGSSRLSPRNTAVARLLRSRGRLGTLLFDLLTPAEDQDYSNRFDIELLTGRLVDVTEWLLAQAEARALPVGYFGASTGAAAALRAAAALPADVAAVVSRGGRPDLAMEALPAVSQPTLLIVGGNDPAVERMNAAALRELGSEIKEMRIVPGATHLFEEPGTLEVVEQLALEWFERYLAEDG